MSAILVRDDPPGLEEAIATLRAGGLVALPTDTVYGLGIALDAQDGLARLFAAKERPLDRAIVLLLDSVDQAGAVGEITPAARALAEACWPGGLTLVLRQTDGAALPPELTGGISTIGLRIPDHACPRALARTLGPLPVTSANISGRPPALDAADVLAQLGDRIQLVVDGGPVKGGTASTVVDCSIDRPRILREGALGTAALAAILDEAGVLHAIAP